MSPVLVSKCLGCKGAGVVHGHDHGQPFVTLCGWCKGTGKEPR
jgi:DnaJ-class molecular chaperone